MSSSSSGVNNNLPSPSVYIDGRVSSDLASGQNRAISGLTIGVPFPPRRFSRVVPTEQSGRVAVSQAPGENRRASSNFPGRESSGTIGQRVLGEQRQLSSRPALDPPTHSVVGFVRGRALPRAAASQAVGGNRCASSNFPGAASSSTIGQRVFGGLIQPSSHPGVVTTTFPQVLGVYRPSLEPGFSNTIVQQVSGRGRPRPAVGPSSVAGQQVPEGYRSRPAVGPSSVAGQQVPEGYRSRPAVGPSSVAGQQVPEGYRPRPAVDSSTMQFRQPSTMDSMERRELYSRMVTLLGSEEQCDSILEMFYKVLQESSLCNPDIRQLMERKESELQKLKNEYAQLFRIRAKEGRELDNLRKKCLKLLGEKNTLSRCYEELDRQLQVVMRREHSIKDQLERVKEELAAKVSDNKRLTEELDNISSRRLRALLDEVGDQSSILEPGDLPEATAVSSVQPADFFMVAGWKLSDIISVKRDDAESWDDFWNGHTLKYTRTVIDRRYVPGHCQEVPGGIKVLVDKRESMQLCKVDQGPSNPSGFGLRATEDIKAGTHLLMASGVITKGNKEALNTYTFCLVFTEKDHWVLDTRSSSNECRFFSDSQTPNVDYYPVVVSGVKYPVIVFKARTDIKKDDLLTINYCPPAIQEEGLSLPLRKRRREV